MGPTLIQLATAIFVILNPPLASTKENVFKMKNTLSQLFALPLRAKMLLLICIILAPILFALEASSTTFLFDYIVIIVAMVMIEQALRRLSDLKHRASITDNSPTIITRLEKTHTTSSLIPIEQGNWEVEINDVIVGEITDRVYASILYQEYTNFRNYLKQFINITSAAYHFTFSFLRVFPVILFWLIVVSFLLSPDDFLQGVHEIQTYSPALIVTKLWSTLLSIFVGCIFVTLVLSVTGIKVFGVRNEFSNAICDRIRKYLKQPADGSISVSRLETIGISVMQPKTNSECKQ